MKALVTGASSGIGKEIAICLAELKIDLVLVARREEILHDIADELKKKYQIAVDVKSYDLKDLNNCQQLVEDYKDIDIFINNAGFGDAGDFIMTDLDKELSMIDLNIKANHVLLKGFVKNMLNKEKGYILNVASLAAFQPGPKMATYYATKAYVSHLSQAVNYELKKDKKKITISTLCPGPVATEFNKVANVNFTIKELDAHLVALRAVKGMFKGKSIIIPSTSQKILIFLERFVPRKLIIKLMYKIQYRKQNGK